MEQHLPRAGLSPGPSPVSPAVQPHRSSSRCPGPLGDVKNKGCLKGLRGEGGQQHRGGISWVLQLPHS